ncbi:hypothetical protein DFH06DRAFT_1407136 [Mycena polygramma]|nr:hypothetical protein DFH06DRAFT_1407136 [Mycena polygramma]
MHKSLQLKTLDRLPLRSRRVALAAAQGSVENLQLILVSVGHGPCVHSILYLPVCWDNLDPAKIPSSYELDILLAKSEGCEIFLRPFLALQTMYFIPDIPQQALVDFWPRIWPWVQFFDIYGDIIRLCPPLQLYWVFFAYILRFPHSLLNGTPGVRSLAAKAWVAYVEGGDAHAGGFDCLLRFIELDCVAMCDAHLGEYAAGVGDSADRLATLLREHLVIVKSPKTLGPVRVGIRFALAIGASEASSIHSNFQTCLRRRGILAVVTEITWHLTQRLPKYPENAYLTDTVTDCLSLLVLGLCHPTGYIWIAEAIRAGLLNVLVHLARAQRAEEDHTRYIQLLLAETHKATAYYSVLRDIERFFPELLKGIQPFPNSPMFSQWAAFVALVKDRLELKRRLDSPDFVAYRACDNLSCGKIMQKSNLKACAACRTMHYCDASCQRVDWPGHRQSCRSLRTIHLSDPLTGRDKSFMLALIQQTYRRNLTDILRFQAGYMADSGRSDFLIALDFTTGIPDISFVRHEGGEKTDVDLQWTAYGPRALRDPRMVLNAAHFPGQPLRIFPIRPLDTRLHEGLAEFAHDLRQGACDNEQILRRLEALKLEALKQLDTTTTF